VLLGCHIIVINVRISFKCAHLRMHIIVIIGHIIVIIGHIIVIIGHIIVIIGHIIVIIDTLLTHY